MVKRAIALVVTFLAVLSFFFYLADHADDGPPVYRAFGQVDVRVVALAFEAGGRIDTLTVDEGAAVKTGDVLGRLDTRALMIEKDALKAKMNAARAKYDLALAGYRDEDIRAAKATVQALRDKVKLAKITADRTRALFASKACSRQDLDKATLTLAMTESELAKARAGYERLTHGLRYEDVRVARAGFEAARAQYDAVIYRIHEASVLRAPCRGQIQSRLAESGEMTAAGRTVFELALIDPKRLRVYVTQPQLAYVKVGDRATVHSDTTEPVQATVSSISEEAEFTPKTVQTEELRTTLVYEVRLNMPDPAHRFKLGQPISVDFPTK